MLQTLLILMCCAWPTVTEHRADVTGRWRVTISDGKDAIVGVASLEQSGQKVTGSLGPDETDTTPVSGVLDGDKLTLKTQPRPGFVVPFDTCELTVSDNRMTGVIQVDGAKRRIEFERLRQASER